MTAGFTARHPRLVRALATGFVALAALLAAVWLAPRASGAAATWLRTPAVHLRTLHAPGDGSLRVGRSTGRAASAPVTLDAGMRFTMAGVVCDPLPTGAATVGLRTSLDGRSWSRWYRAPLETADETGPAEAFTDPVWTGDARYVQVAATSGSRRAPAELSGVRLVAIDPTGDSSVAARVEDTVRRFAATVAGVSLEQPALAAANQPVIVTRAEWGADESLRSGSPAYSPVKMAFVHHTASGNTYTQAEAPALVRGIYAYHTDPKGLGWSDIGYNFLVDRFGTIYEGRYGGITRGVVGAQVYGFNTGSTGISVMGTFTDVAPPAEAVAALERLLAWKLSVAGLDPTGTAQLTCGAGQKYKTGSVVSFPVIAGHRDANYTECPGDALYALLPAIRADVAKRMGGGGGGGAITATLTASSALISPNGDRQLDTVNLGVSLSAPADWRLAVQDGAGRVVASWSGSGQASTIHWDGTSAGKTVPDGAYTAELTAGTDTSAAPVTITVDTSAPRLAAAAASPLRFSPNGDGQAETCALTYSPAEACSIRVGIMDSAGDVVRWLQGWREQQTQEYSVSWDGRVTSGSALVAAADGRYRLDIERRDAAGNVARRGVAVVVDCTVGFPTAAPATFSPNGDGASDTTKLAFKLTRKASVTVQIAVGDKVVRTLALGALAAGARSVVWDGKAGSGDFVASCRPVYTVTADSTLGKSSVIGNLVADLYAPRVFAPAGKSTSRGAATKLAFKTVDPYSAKADVRFVVTDAKGRTVATGHPGWLATGKSLSTAWTPPARGAFTVTWQATDLAGNHEAGTTRTVVTVR
jgi:flagellar hook assembly protein FlgD